MSALALLLVSCGGGAPAGGGSPSATNAVAQPPTFNLAPPTSVGASEGALNLIAWEGYLDPSWVKPFQDQTGCIVNHKYAGSSDEMTALMANGGGGQWDMVSSSGDADLRIIWAGDARPVNVNLVPDWQNFQDAFKSPGFNTINGVHYGVSLQWGPNVLLYNTTNFPNPPDSWSTIYSPVYSGKITVPDNPIQIADAALYLSKTQPALGIKDPYELTRAQLDASVSLLKQQRPLIKKYWGLASDEISMFKNGDVTVGAAWPYQTSQLKAINFPVTETIPKEGATGWADTWMMAAKAPHPNCAYKWLQYISTPTVQAQQAVGYGETPVNKLACPEMEKIAAGSCAQFHADAPASYLQAISLWKTPIATCPDGSKVCMPYSEWQNAWTQVKG